MDDKTCLITGATHGVGKAVAELLASRGARVIITGRDRNKLEAVSSELKARAQNQQLSYVHADQMSLQQTRGIADALDEIPSIDVLINNAGVCPDARVTNTSGLEQAFVTNYLSHFLLTQSLLPKIRASQQGRVVHLSSLAMGNGRINLADLQAESAYDGWQAYSNSKLAIVLFSNLLAEQLADSKVTSNAVCPGIVDTNLIKNHSAFSPGMMENLKQAMQTPEESAELVVALALDEKLASVSGAFFSKSYGAGSPLRVNWDKHLAQQLWDVSKQLVSI